MPVLFPRVSRCCAEWNNIRNLVQCLEHSKSFVNAASCLLFSFTFRKPRFWPISTLKNKFLKNSFFFAILLFIHPFNFHVLLPSIGVWQWGADTLRLVWGILQVFPVGENPPWGHMMMTRTSQASYCPRSVPNVMLLHRKRNHRVLWEGARLSCLPPLLAQFSAWEGSRA